MIVWVIAALLGLATGLRIGWALVNKQSLVSTAMILALGCLGLVAALNWQPLTLLIDTALHWPNIAMGLSQVALIASAAGSCVMITTVASDHRPVITRRIAFAQYAIAAVIAAASLVSFFAKGKQSEMAPQEYLIHSLGWSWLLPLLYIMLAMTLVSWAGMRHSNRTRRGRALFVFTIGIVLIVLASAFFLLQAIGTTRFVGVGAAATLLGSAMVVVAAGSLLPSIEDWFGARYELRVVRPLLAELGRRHADIGIGIRPRGPLAFRVAERMSLISDALFLEATEVTRRERVEATQRDPGSSLPIPNLGAEVEIDALEAPPVAPREQARAIAEWIYAGRALPRDETRAAFPGLNWLRKPDSYSDREWILAIATEYRALEQN